MLKLIGILGCVAFFMSTLSGCSQLPNGNRNGTLSDEEHARQLVANQQYLDLVAEIKRTPDPARLKLLREYYVQTSYYNPYLLLENAWSIKTFDAIANKNWSDCLAHTDSILARNYISLNAHYGAMVCNFESKNVDKGEYHQEVLDSLMVAIWQTGDGKSPESAFFCTSTVELYAFVNLHGFNVKGQALVWVNNKPYDKMEIVNPRDEHEFTWYFDISSQAAKGFSVPEL